MQTTLYRYQLKNNQIGFNPVLEAMLNHKKYGRLGSDNSKTSYLWQEEEINHSQMNQKPVACWRCHENNTYQTSIVNNPEMNNLNKARISSFHSELTSADSVRRISKSQAKRKCGSMGDTGQYEAKSAKLSIYTLEKTPAKCSCQGTKSAYCMSGNKIRGFWIKCKKLHIPEHG